MIELVVEDRKLELSSFDESATLAELRDEVGRRRVSPGLVTRFCAGCGRCCYLEHLPLLGLDLLDMRRRRQVDLSPWVQYPVPPDRELRRRGIDEITRQHDIDQVTAALLDEYNTGEPISYKKRLGGCIFLENGLCTNYDGRAFTCGLYVCNMGDRLSSLQEQIVRQGIWHSYYVEGWIEESEIAHNPFLGHSGYETVPLASFEVDLQDALESLFFYF